MKRINFRWIVPALILFLVTVWWTPAQARAATATDTLKKATDQVIDIVTSAKYKKDKKLRRAMLHDVIDPLFSYEQMSMRSLAKNWKQRTPSEKQEFVKLFSNLLENSYASKLESYSNETINYLGEKVKGKYAMVKTEIARPDGSIAVDYKFIKHKDSWKVYDFVIEGVSMIRNYRSQFNRIIKKDSYEALRNKLNGKIRDIES
ncbi:MAG: phospholipid-binding protein MlaC [Nitrospinales bacterium]